MAFNVTFLYRCSRARSLGICSFLLARFLSSCCCCRCCCCSSCCMRVCCCTGGFVHPSAPFPPSHPAQRLWKKGVAKRQAGFKGGGGAFDLFNIFPQLINAVTEQQLYKSRCVSCFELSSELKKNFVISDFLT